jgi:Leucine-rich repeat (LRR) protein
LEELQIKGCNFSDSVPTTVLSSDLTSGANSPQRSNEYLIPTIAKLFPNLKTLNLSFNAITNTSLTPDALSSLILASPSRNGLRHLRLRGNKISDLEGFLKLAEAFKRNRDVPSWTVEELGLRINEIGKLPPELGLLPLDNFLVVGNT